MGALAKTIFFLGLASLQAAERSPQSRYFGDAARGEAVAARWCVSCHRLDGSLLDDQVPTFASLAASERSESEIRGFLVKPHRPMPPLTLSNQQIEDLIAYLRSRRPVR